MGEDLLSVLGDELRGLFDVRRILLLTGPNVRRLYGKTVEGSLGGAGFEFGVMVIEVPSLDTASEVLARNSDAQLVIGLGGGKPIDVAKYVAYKSGVPIVSVPTSAAHDGIASPFASLKGAMKPYSMVTLPPKMVIADIDVIAGSPPRLIRSGIGDLIAKLTAVEDWRLSNQEKNEYFGEYAAHLALLSAKVAMENSESIGVLSKEGIRTLVEALISAGVAAGIAGSSRPCSGSEHLISHAIDLLEPGRGLHGEKVGVATTLSAALHGMDWRRVRDVLERAGAPTGFGQLGISRDIACRAIVRAPAIRPERYTILHKLGLNYEEACSLVDEVGVA